MTATTDNRELRALVQKWRDSASGAKRYSTTEHEDGFAAAERTCADELEALLARTEAGACTCGVVHSFDCATRTEADEAATVGAVDRLCRWFWDNAMVTGDISGSPEDYREHAEKLLAFLGTHPQDASAVPVPKDNDGKEQDAFEAWAKSEGFDMVQHPLHWLFLNERTNAARKGWRGALAYADAALHQPAKGGAL
jgi:hypothetical protein